MKGMKGNYLRKFASFILVGLMLTGVACLFSQPTEAQRRVIVVQRPFYQPWGWRRPFGYDPYFDYYSRYGQYVFTNSNAAYNAGYHSGVKTGAGDATHRRSYDPQRSHYFQEAGFGNFGEVYRSGFVSGYARGYRS